MVRKAVAGKIQDQILTKSRRRCCICYGLGRDTSIKSGQIAHLDRKNENNEEGNLAFLCLNHHDIYDSSTRQSKNFTIGEVKAYRNELYLALDMAFGKKGNNFDMVEGHYIRDGEYESAELKVKHLESGDYHVTGTALWGKEREYGPNIGELDFIGELINDAIEYAHVYPDGKAWRIWLRFKDGFLEVVEDNWMGVHGMNVTFSGTYSKSG